MIYDCQQIVPAYFVCIQTIHLTLGTGIVEIRTGPSVIAACSRVQSLSYSVEPQSLLLASHYTSQSHPQWYPRRN